MSKSKDTPLPTEPFCDTISTEQIEERLEFAPWATTTETVTVEVTCTDATGCRASVEGSVAFTDTPWDAT